MKRLLPFVVLILLLVAGILSIPYFLRPESHRAQITETLSKLLKHPVVIGKISMTYWPPTLDLQEVAVLREDGNSFLQIKNARAPLDLASLFHLQFVPSEVQLNQWVLSIMRLQNGGWDLSGWLSGAQGFSGAKSWTIRQVSWKEGEIHWIDRFGPDAQELVLGSVEGHWDPRQTSITTSGMFTGIGSPAQLTLNAKGQFFSMPEWSGDLALANQGSSCALHIDDKSDVLDFKGGAASWPLANALAFAKFYARGAAAATVAARPLTLDNWQIHATAKAGHLSVEHSASISGGLSEIKASVDNMEVRGEFALKDVPAQAILMAMGENLGLDGKITGVGRDLELSLSTQTMSSMSGDGFLQLNNGQYQLPPLTVQKLSKAKTMTYLQNKFPNLQQNGIPVAATSAHWRAKAGIISIEDGFLVSTDLKAGWVGKVDAARHGLDGYVRVQIREKDPKLARFIPQKYRASAAYGRVQGGWQEWHLKTIPTSKIPSAVQSKLRKAIGQ